MLVRRAAIALLFMACGGTGPVAHPRAELGADGERTGDVSKEDVAFEPRGLDVPYDRAIQKSVHNAYARFEPLLDQLIYHRVRSIELDVHQRREGERAPAGDWFVYHEDNPLMRRSSCMELSDCLEQIAAFHRAVPQHEVVTLFLDLKDGGGEGHSPNDLDETVARILGRRDIVQPRDVVRACPGATTLRQAVTGACSFPTLESLRGKFIVATTGGTLCAQKSPLSKYGHGDLQERLAFVAPEVSAGCPAAKYESKPDVVFYNLPFAERARARELRARGNVVRIYGGGLDGGLDDATAFAAALTSGAVHLATDKVNDAADSWTSTHGPRGFPFACDRCGRDLVEAANVLAMRAISGDQWGRTDASMLAYEASADDATYSALVSVPSSHVEPLAKACLVARSSDEPNAANVSVCRPLDRRPPRAQIRLRDGATTSAVEAPSFQGLTAESGAFLRLDVKAAGAGSIVTAAVSADGRSWTTITTTAMPMRLPVRGISLSSHGAAEVKALYLNLAKTSGATTTSFASADLLQRPLGPAARGEAFDGLASVLGPHDRASRPHPSSL